MSTDQASARRRFSLRVLLVIGVLAVLATAGAVAGLVQGPRVSDVSSEPARAVQAAASRVVITANQALQKIEASQVSVTPAVGFTVDASGRTVGVRFDRPLAEGTTYTIRVTDAQGAGGGASATLETAVTTPRRDVFALRRSATGDDMIYRAALSRDGTSDETVIYTAPQIEDFRRTATGLVVSLIEDDRARLVEIDDDGSNPQEIALPGAGTVTRLQVSDRGALVGYLFSDMGVENGGGRESQLMISSLREPDRQPTAFSVKDEALSVVSWQFVPETSSLLTVAFGGDLMLSDPLGDDEPALLGTAVEIDDVSRGTYTALLAQMDGFSRVDLRTATDEPLTPPKIEPSVEGATQVTPEKVHALAGDDVLWTMAQRDATGIPLARTLVAESGEEQRVLTTVTSSTTVVLDACPDPAGERIALTETTDLVTDTYDQHAQPLPSRVATRVISAADGTELALLPGFDMSWCAAGPW